MVVCLLWTDWVILVGHMVFSLSLEKLRIDRWTRQIHCDHSVKQYIHMKRLNVQNIMYLARNTFRTIEPRKCPGFNYMFFDRLYSFGASKVFISAWLNRNGIIFLFGWKIALRKLSIIINYSRALWQITTADIWHDR